MKIGLFPFHHIPSCFLIIHKKNTFHKRNVKKVFKMLDSSQKEYYNAVTELRKEMKS
nr:MAG TPA: hypothetical protein [Caudoviricetes sp.]